MGFSNCGDVTIILTSAQHKLGINFKFKKLKN